MNIEKTCHRAKENGAEGSKGTEDFPQSSRPEHYLQKDQSHDMSWSTALSLHTPPENTGEIQK